MGWSAMYMAQDFYFIFLAKMSANEFFHFTFKLQAEK